MKARIRSIGTIRLSPVRRHPASPAELPELRKPHRLDRTCGDRQFDLPIELVADIEEYQIGQGFAAPAAWQVLHVVRHRLDEDADPELVLHAIDAGPHQDIDDEPAV